MDKPCEHCGCLRKLQKVAIVKQLGPNLVTFDFELCDDCADEARFEQLDRRDYRDD